MVLATGSFPLCSLLLIKAILLDLNEPILCFTDQNRVGRSGSLDAASADRASIRIEEAGIVKADPKERANNDCSGSANSGSHNSRPAGGIGCSCLDFIAFRPISQSVRVDRFRGKIGYCGVAFVPGQPAAAEGHIA